MLYNFSKSLYNLQIKVFEAKNYEGVKFGRIVVN
jgi:hypothetical protein